MIVTIKLKLAFILTSYPFFNKIVYAIYKRRNESHCSLYIKTIYIFKAVLCAFWCISRRHGVENREQTNVIQIIFFSFIHIHKAPIHTISMLLYWSVIDYSIASRIVSKIFSLIEDARLTRIIR